MNSNTILCKQNSTNKFDTFDVFKHKLGDAYDLQSNRLDRIVEGLWSKF